MHGRVFITYDELSRRLTNGDGRGGAVELAPNEHLTPAAMDLVGQRGLTVHRLPGKPAEKRPADRTRPASAGQGPLPDGPGRPDGPQAPVPRVGLVVCRPDDRTRTLVDSLHRAGQAPADFSLQGCWIANLRAMCRAIVGGQLAAGIVLAEHAPEVVVLANKIRAVRAVQATSRQAVSDAVQRVAANVLIVEHVRASFHEIRSMIQAFVAGRTGQAGNGPLLAALEELERT